MNSTDRPAVKTLRTHPEVAALEQRLDGLRAQKAQLEAELDALRAEHAVLKAGTDPGEQIARLLSGAGMVDDTEAQARLEELPKLIRDRQEKAGLIGRAVSRGSLDLEVLGRRPDVVAWCIEPVQAWQKQKAAALLDHIRAAVAVYRDLQDLEQETLAAGLPNRALPSAAVDLPNPAETEKAFRARCLIS